MEDERRDNEKGTCLHLCQQEKGKGGIWRLERSRQALNHCLHSSPQSPGMSTPLAGAAPCVLWGCAACPCTQPPVLCLLTGRQLSASFYNPR